MRPPLRGIHNPKVPGSSPGVASQRKPRRTPGLAYLPASGSAAQKPEPKRYIPFCELRTRTMPKLVRRIPSYRRHRASGQAVVTLDGRDFYLGPHGTKVSRAEYDRVVGEWQANGRRLPRTDDRFGDITVNELALDYLRFAEGYYVKAGRSSGELHHIKGVIRVTRPLYGRTAVTDFTPLALRAVQEKLVAAGHARTYINGQVNRLRRMFKWGVSNDMVGPSVLTALQAVAPLKRGRTEAREPEPVKPVPEAHIEALQDHVPRPVFTMIEAQRLTGMRPGEVVIMRTMDIEDTDAAVWVYRPCKHKTEHHDRHRTIYIGPQAQNVLRPWLRPELTAFLFQPREAVASVFAERSAKRTTPLSCGNRPGTNRKARPKRQPGDRYTVDSYRRAIQRGCERAGIPAWHPHQLRHTAATKLRKQFGIEAARVVLGHRSAAITEVYAQLDRSQAAEIMAKIG